MEFEPRQYVKVSILQQVWVLGYFCLAQLSTKNKWVISAALHDMDTVTTVVNSVLVNDIVHGDH